MHILYARCEGWILCFPYIRRTHTRHYLWAIPLLRETRIFMPSSWSGGHTWMKKENWHKKKDMKVCHALLGNVKLAIVCVCVRACVRACVRVCV